MPDFPEITTARLRLRAFCDADAPAVQRLAGDRRVADTTLHVPHPYPDGAAEVWIATRAVAWQMGQGLALAITLRESEELVGAIGCNIVAAERSAEIGYWIGVAFWNQGYCTEALRALIGYGFSELGLVRVHAHHLARNPASGRVLQKAGMHFEGTRENALIKWGRAEAAHFYALTRSEWTRPPSGAP